jgi:hypothetical protein
MYVVVDVLRAHRTGRSVVRMIVTHEFDRCPTDEAASEVRLRVQPEDAAVYVDGELHGTARRLTTLRLSPGHHRFEIVRPGFRPAEREVTLGRGESVAVDVDLGR